MHYTLKEYIKYIIKSVINIIRNAKYSKNQRILKVLQNSTTKAQTTNITQLATNENIRTKTVLQKRKQLT